MASVKLKYAAYMALFRPLSLLPLWALYRLSDGLRFLLQRVIKYRRKVVRENLGKSFPQLTQEQLRRIEHRFYLQLTDNIVETIKLLHISDRQLRRRVTVEGASLVEEIAAQQRPVFLYLGHYGNWEWVPSIMMHYNQPKVSAQIYKGLRDEAFDKVMQRVRDRFKSVNIPQDKAMRTMLRLRRDYSSFIVGIIDDHSPNHGRSPHTMDFLNHPLTLINVGAEELGHRLDAAFLYLDIEKPRRGHYRLTFKPIDITGIHTHYPYTHRYMRMLEDTIRRDPGLWLWSHKRWRHSPKSDVQSSHYHNETHITQQTSLQQQQ